MTKYQAEAEIEDALYHPIHDDWWKIFDHCQTGSWTKSYIINRVKFLNPPNDWIPALSPGSLHYKKHKKLVKQFNSELCIEV